MWRALVLACLVSLGTWPAKAEAEPSGKGLSFRMLTFNTWGLPVPIGRQVPERFSRLSQSLAGFDWVTLQETFTRHAAQLRTSRLYPFQAWQSEGGFFQISSGLYTLSRFPIVAQAFREFRQSTDFDRFSRKGVLFTRLQVRPDLQVDVYNTHYQAQDAAEAERIRQYEDNRVLAEMVRAHDQGHPIFIQGDLNCLDHGPAYQDLRRRLPLRDLWRDARAGDPGWTMDRGRNPHTADRERLDYLFFLDDPRWQAQVEHIDLALTAPVRGLYLSDHLGVQATITLRPRILLASHDAPGTP